MWGVTHHAGLFLLLCTYTQSASTLIKEKKKLSLDVNPGYTSRFPHICRHLKQKIFIFGILSTLAPNKQFENSWGFIFSDCLGVRTQIYKNPQSVKQLLLMRNVLIEMKVRTEQWKICFKKSYLF